MSHADTAVIELDRLAVRYGKFEALKEVSVKIEAGTVFALLGRNGVGKSSLVRCLLGHQPATSGRVRLFGKDCWRHRAELMDQVGVVPEEPDAPPEMNANQLGKFCARLHRRWDAGGYSTRLQRCEVPTATSFSRLSKGQKAQVMLSLALASTPRLLVLDDPTLGLDAVARRSVYEELVVELADRELTVLMTSHDLSGIEGIATRVGVLRDGRLAIDEELEDLKSRFRHIAFGRVEGTGDRRSDGSDLLADLEPLDVKSRGRGIEALVSRFDEAGLEHLRSSPEIDGVEVWPASLEEITIALTDVSPGARA